MRIATILSAAILALVVLAAPALAHHRDGHAGGPPAGAQKHANKDDNDNNQGGTNRFGAENAQDCEENARNHGQYVSCVVHLVHAEQGDVEAKDIGLDRDCDNVGNLIACAAQSDVGKDKNGQATSRSADNNNDED